jgi:hypothetical protein
MVLILCRLAVSPRIQPTPIAKDTKRPTALLDHNTTNLVGRVEEQTEQPEGLFEHLGDPIPV